MDNPYGRMLLDRVRADAIHGVAAARQAFRARDPVGADLLFGPVVSPEEQQEYRDRVMDAIAGYQRARGSKARTCR
ncbi:MAG TPA: hypothetical protein PLF11_08685 [Bacillota bacterium]|nr:hypothetical protein [Verrucomicrobiota bacterium]HOI37444.1 hypothetical protein [Bacillota bacterium]